MKEKIILKPVTDGRPTKVKGKTLKGLSGQSQK